MIRKQGLTFSRDRGAFLKQTVSLYKNLSARRGRSHRRRRWSALGQFRPMRECAQDRCNNNVAAGNTEGKGTQDGEEHGGGGEYGSHLLLILLRWFVWWSRLLSTGLSTFSAISAQMSALPVLLPRVMSHHDLWSLSPQVTEVIPPYHNCARRF